ncbi:MAG TPA: YafY family protein [Opitutaceae bacterium]|nr:YafY family protein [Opitutaceae bacterium]
MNRTDRLVAMVMQLQGRRVVRAEELAMHFEVTVRTIYRDVAALGEAGVPVVGEAGVGYSLVKGYHLPPVMFTAEEATAMFVGGELVKQFSDASLAPPMESALAKIRSVLPRERQDDLDRLARATAILGSPRLPSGIDQRVLLPIQQAIVTRRVARLNYRGRARSEETLREVEPLGVVYYGGAWYLVAWCRLRGDFRQFKLERIGALEVLNERFAARPDFSLREHLKKEIRGTDATFPARAWFTARAFDRVRRESFTGFVEARPLRDGYEADFLTFSLEWFAHWLLSFGQNAEALAPVKLRTLMRRAGEDVAKQYK